MPVLADSTFWEINALAFNIAARVNEVVVFAMLVPSINKKVNINWILFWIAIFITAFSLVIIVPTLAGLGLDGSQENFRSLLFVCQTTQCL